MILIGSYFSPFVRRSAVTLREYGFPYEHRSLGVWDDADEALRTRMVAGIVPFEMDVTRLEGNFKLGQNRSSEDRARIVAHLTASPDTNSAAVGHAMDDRAK